VRGQCGVKRKADGSLPLLASSSDPVPSTSRAALSAQNFDISILPNDSPFEVKIYLSY
jgi:hypothetical protein